MSISNPAHRSARSWMVALDGARLREVRRERGLSQEELADRAGISAATVARLERQRKAACRGRTVARLAAALGEQPASIGLLAAPDDTSAAAVQP